MARKEKGAPLAPLPGSLPTAFTRCGDVNTGAGANQRPRMGSALRYYLRRYMSDLQACEPFRLQHSLVDCCANLLDEDERQEGVRS